MKVIFYNDDFGLSKGFTDAIADCIKTGVTSSSCIRTNGTSFDYATKILKTKKLTKNITGIHFNITDGYAENKNLRNSNNSFKYSYLNYLFMNDSLIQEIEKEFKIQLDKALSAGFKIDHINSQEHIHMIPQIFELTCRIAKQYKIKKIRITNEHFYQTKNFTLNTTPFINSNIIKFLLLNNFSKKDKILAKSFNLKSPDSFCGVLFTNNMSYEAVTSGILKAKERKVKVLEILGHPAYAKPEKKWTSIAIKNYVYSKNRKIETNTFLDEKKELLNFLNKNKIKPISYLSFR